MTMLVTADQRAIFWGFFDDTTQDGSLPFTMSNPSVDGWSLATGDGAPLLTGDGTPIVLASTWLAKFGDGVPNESVVGVGYRISFQIMVMP